MQELINRQWNQFITDVEKAEQRLRTYVARFILTVQKGQIDRQEAVNFIRSIPNVTTVTKEAEGTDQPDYFKALFSIKFVLEPYEDLNTYIIRVLKKDLQKIKGIRVNSYKGVEELD